MKQEREKIRVCFIADKHSLYDDRIYWKMALSLQKRGYEIYYLLIGDKEENGITKEGVIYQSYKLETFSNNRYVNYLLKYSRFRTNYTRLLNKAREIKAEIYHFHDLNINRIGKKLKQLPHRPVVIYDARDPFSVNIKDYIGSQSKLKWAVNVYANYIELWEKKCAKNYDFVISNEENVRDKFRTVLPDDRVDVIYNYTYLHKYRKELSKKYDLIYCGGISEFRGALKIVEAIQILKKEFAHIKMIFLGTIFSEELKNEMHEFINAHDLTKNVILKDTVPYHEVIDYYNLSKIGLGIFLPINTHKIILPIKIFEYMAMGLPIIGSNFGHINDFILKDKVGIPVNPTRPGEIAQAVKNLLQDRQYYNQLKINGINAVEKNYNWPIMEEKLFSIYDRLLTQRETVLQNVK